jgi:hypothetical protein
MKRMPSIIAKSLFVILISGGSLASTARAQFDPAITVNVPFAFSADGQEFAAGTYQLQLISSNFLLSVRKAGTGHQQMITVRPEQDRKIAARGRLTFRVCDGQNFLAQVHIPGTNLFSETLNGDGQKGAEAIACSKHDSITVALR